MLFALCGRPVCCWWEALQLDQYATIMFSEYQTCTKNCLRNLSWYLCPKKCEVWLVGERREIQSKFFVFVAHL
jgi:hypothetical protein